MGNKILVITLISTGIIVALVGIQSLYTFWGEVTFPGLTGQLTGVICIMGGLVNIWVSFKVKKRIHYPHDML